MKLATLEKVSRLLRVKPGSRVYAISAFVYRYFVLEKGNTFRGGYRKFYSQFGEDVVLLNLIGNGVGTYIDIGAGHPIRGSNTYALYLQGWSGILIDPILTNVESARRYRSRDTSICALCGLDEEAKWFYEYETYELSTGEESRVKQLAEEGAHPSRKYQIQSISLRSLGMKASPVDRVILSVDVEGAEMAVLKHNDWASFLPPIIIAEEYTPAWLGLSEIRTLLEAKGYELSDRVGLSSIYLHTESPYRIKVPGIVPA